MSRTGEARRSSRLSDANAARPSQELSMHSLHTLHESSPSLGSLSHGSLSSAFAHTAAAYAFANLHASDVAVSSRDGPYPSEHLYVAPKTKLASATHAVQKETYEITISVILDKPPMNLICVLYTHKKGGQAWYWHELGRTEVIYGVNPKFIQTLLFEHEVNADQPVKICLYRSEDGTRYLRNVDPYGEAMFSEAEFARSDEQTITRDLRASTDSALDPMAQSVGTVQLDIVNMKVSVEMTFEGDDLKSPRANGILDSYFILYRYIHDFYSNPKNVGRPEDDAFDPIYRSETIRASNHPKWKTVKLSLKRLCDCEFGELLLLRFFDSDRTGSHTIIGEWKTTLYDLCIATGLVKKDSQSESQTPDGPKIAEFQLSLPQIMLKKEQNTHGILRVHDFKVHGREIALTEAVSRSGDDKFNEARSAIYARSKYSGRSRARSRHSGPSLLPGSRKDRNDDTQSFGGKFGAVSWSGGLSGFSEEEEEEEAPDEDVMSDIDSDTNECINLMIETLEQPSVDDRYKAVLEVHGLVYHHEKLRRAFIDRGGLDVLLNLMDKDPFTQEKVAFVLKNITASAYARERLRASGALMRIVPHLETAPLFVQKQIVWLLAHICGDNNESRDILRELGVFDVLRGLLESTDDKMLEYTMFAIASICHKNEINQELAVELGYLAPLVECLSSSSERLRISSLNALSNISANSDVARTVLREIGGLGKIFSMLEDESESLIYSVLCSVSSAIYENVTNQDLLRDSGALKKIVSMLSHTQELIQEMAAVCLINAIAENEKNKVCVRELNGIMPLLTLARGKLPSLPYLATAATKNLGSVGHNRSFIQRLVRLLH